MTPAQELQQMYAGILPSLMDIQEGTRAKRPPEGALDTQQQPKPRRSRAKGQGKGKATDHQDRDLGYHQQLQAVAWPRCATQPPRAGHDRALHVHQQALAAGGHPAPSVPDQCGVEETHGELAEAQHVAPGHDLPDFLLELKVACRKS